MNEHQELILSELINKREYLLSYSNSGQFHPEIDSKLLAVNAAIEWVKGQGCQDRKILPPIIGH